MPENQHQHEKYIFLKFIVFFFGGGLLVFLVENEIIPGISLMPNPNKNVLLILSVFIWIGISFYFAKDARSRFQHHCPCRKCIEERLLRREVFLKNASNATRKIWSDLDKKK